MINQHSKTPDLSMTLSRRRDCRRWIDMPDLKGSLKRAGGLVATFKCSFCLITRTLTVKLDGDAVTVEWRNTSP